MNDRLRLSASLALCLLAAGCGDDDEGTPLTDAGADAAALDGGTDDGGADAGEVEPGPITMAREAALEAAADLDLAMDAVPAEMRADGDLLRAGLLGVRVDAVIGEKSVISIFGVIGEKIPGSVSLSPAAIGALVVLRQLDRSIAEANRLADDFAPSTQPSIIEVHDALIALREQLESLRILMEARYVALIEEGGGGVTVDAEYESYLPVRLVPEGLELPAVCEGPAPGGVPAQIEVSCNGEPTPGYSVVDDETGDPILDAQPPGTGGIIEQNITLESGRPTAMRIRLAATGTAGEWPNCYVKVRGTRRWRSSPIAIDAGEARELGTQISQWDGAMGNLANEIEHGVFGANEQELVEVVREYAAELMGESARWRGLATEADIDQEDFEVTDLTLGLVMLPLLEALEQDPRLASTQFLTVRQSLAAMRTTDEAARLLLEPTHSSDL